MNNWANEHISSEDRDLGFYLSYHYHSQELGRNINDWNHEENTNYGQRRMPPAVDVSFTYFSQLSSFQPQQSSSLSEVVPQMSYSHSCPMKLLIPRSLDNYLRDDCHQNFKFQTGIIECEGIQEENDTLLFHTDQRREIGVQDCVVNLKKYYEDYKEAQLNEGAIQWGEQESESDEDNSDDHSDDDHNDFDSDEEVGFDSDDDEGFGW
ncbi:MAG: hypothetical protein EZS28_039608 [Streblomastix strix]|uniref:Uncharacterized protein n=1 Tax=Streblomastix strix TaxID=222440 RepID=A0A5J4U297_9EUKA|nr:MAG: hypothetical protein EZS28_039608 [Streblomastix strix]